MLCEPYEATITRFAFILNKIPNVGDEYRWFGNMHPDFDEFWEKVGCSVERLNLGMDFTVITRIQPQRDLAAEQMGPSRS